MSRKRINVNMLWREPIAVGTYMYVSDDNVSEEEDITAVKMLKTEEGMNLWQNMQSFIDQYVAQESDEDSSDYIDEI